VKGVDFREAGLVAMANVGKDTNGSQFFITLDDTTGLNGQYTIIGKIVKGYDVLRRISYGCGTTNGTPKCDVKVVDSGIYNYDQYYSKLKF
jgi:peptidyl-prolyl cis-trans isomerase B (cyclophilin B)